MRLPLTTRTRSGSVGVAAVATAGAIACTAATAGICGGVIATIATTATIGAAAGAANYALSGGCHTAKGYLISAGVGGLLGGVGGGAGEYATGAADLVNGVEEYASQGDELFLPEEYYNAKEEGLAPGQSSPYSTYERFTSNGDLKQVTTYDQFGDRAYQYELGSGVRHGEGFHSFDYGPESPRQAPGGGIRGPHLPFQ